MRPRPFAPPPPPPLIAGPQAGGSFFLQMPLCCTASQGLHFRCVSDDCPSLCTPMLVSGDTGGGGLSSEGGGGR